MRPLFPAPPRIGGQGLGIYLGEHPMDWVHMCWVHVPGSETNRTQAGLEISHLCWRLFMARRFTRQFAYTRGNQGAETGRQRAVQYHVKLVPMPLLRDIFAAHGENKIHRNLATNEYVTERASNQLGARYMNHIAPRANSICDPYSGLGWATNPVASANRTYERMRETRSKI
jgi:hypothetical protein